MYAEQGVIDAKPIQMAESLLIRRKLLHDKAGSFADPDEKVGLITVHSVQYVYSICGSRPVSVNEKLLEEA